MKRIKHWLKVRLSTFLFKHLFNSLTEGDFLKITPRGVVYKGTVLTNADIKSISADADMVSKSTVWLLVKNEVMAKANEIIFTKAKTEDDLLAGRMWLHAIDSIDKKLKKLAKVGERGKTHSEAEVPQG